MILGKEAPSRLIPYAGKEIHMELFGIKQLKLLSKATAIDSVKYMIDALSSVLNMDANELTDGDFHYLFAYQRIAGYEDHPLSVNWTCDGIVFQEVGGLKREFTMAQLAKMTEDYDAASEEDKVNFQNPHTLQVTALPCRHDNSVDVMLSDMSILQVPETINLDERLEWPRMNTYVEAKLLRQDPEKVNLVDAARWVRGETMNDKFQALEEGGLPLFKLACKADAEYVHGYRRNITKQCTRCGRDHAATIDVDAAMFFHV